MFFRRASRDKSDATALEAAPPVNFEIPRSEPRPVTAEIDSPPALPAAELRRRVAAGTLEFETTDDLEPQAGPIGQERALEAVALGIGVKGRDFNVFVIAPPGSQVAAAVTSVIKAASQDAPPPPDRIYVCEFSALDRRRTLALPPGRARPLAQAVRAAIAEVRDALPAAFSSEDYIARRRAIDEQFRTIREDALEALDRKAAQQNIAVLRTPMGFVLAPMHDGKVVKPEVFTSLPQTLRRDVEAKIEQLQGELERLLLDAPRADASRRARLAALDADCARRVVTAAFEDVEAAHRDLPEIMQFLQSAGDDLVQRAAGLLVSHNSAPSAAGAGDGPPERPMANTIDEDPRYHRYRVNVLAAQSGSTAIAGDDRGVPANPRVVSGAPVVDEDHPSLGNLVGRIEFSSHTGPSASGSVLVRPGALHRANGGTLLLDARKLLHMPFAWAALKRCLTSGVICLDHPAGDTGATGETGAQTAPTLDPEPVPLDVKVVLFGDRALYLKLLAEDLDFGRLFKVPVSFDAAVERSIAQERSYARLIASIVKANGLKPVTRDGAARLIEEAVRRASDRETVSTDLGHLADLAREADQRSSLAKRPTTTGADVADAIAGRRERAERLRDRSGDGIGREAGAVETDGARVGQVNAVSVVALGDHASGRAVRVGARVRTGPGRVGDIERAAAGGGASQSDTALTLWGYLAGRYAEDAPLALAASVVFDPPGSTWDTGGTAAAEVFALLSALADVPVRQGLAVAAAVDQWGAMQAISGINDRIEAYFDVCAARGLSGEQGVVIAQANVKHLMLREDVVEAVERGEFAVYAIPDVDAGMALLTRCPAGARGSDGAFPAHSVNRLVEERLVLFADRARRLIPGWPAPPPPSVKAAP